MSFEALAKDPPQVYIAKNACGSCSCHYRKNWKLEKGPDNNVAAMPVYKSQTDPSVVGEIKTGESFYAETGETHVVPLAAEVVFKHIGRTSPEFKALEFKAGEKIHILAYIGEGMYEIWHDGQIFSVDGSEVIDLGNILESSSSHCKEPSPKCWVKITSGKYQATEWIKVKTRQGKAGWIRTGGYSIDTLPEGT